MAVQSLGKETERLENVVLWKVVCEMVAGEQENHYRVQ